MAHINPTCNGPLAGLKFIGRYEAWRETPVGDGTAVATLTDWSGNGNHLTQTTSGQRPLYKTNQINTSLPVWRFDGTDDMVVSASIPAMNNVATRWYYVVYRSNGAAPAGYIRMIWLGENSAAGGLAGDLSYYEQPGDPTRMRIVYNNAGSPGFSAVGPFNTIGTGWHAARLSFDVGTGGKSKVNGETEQSSSLSYTPLNGTFKAVLGSLSSASSSYPLFGDIAAFFFGNTALTSSQRTAMDGYITSIYGITL